MYLTLRKIINVDVFRLIIVNSKKRRFFSSKVEIDLATFTYHLLTFNNLRAVVVTVLYPVEGRI